MIRSTPRSRLLLIELVCDLVIFALCAVVCVALLIQAKSMSRESTHLTQAVYLAQDAADRYLSGREFDGDAGDFLVTYNRQEDTVHGYPAQSILVYAKGRNGQPDRLVYALPILAEERGVSP